MLAHASGKRGASRAEERDALVKVRQPETGARAHVSRGIIEGSHDERRASSRGIRRNDREKDAKT